MNTAGFWIATGERAVRTFAQTLIALFSVGATDLLAADWPAALSAAGMAAVLSALTSIAAGSPAVPGEGPSLTTSEEVTPDYGPEDDLYAP